MTGYVVEAFADRASRILAGPPRLGQTRLVAVDGPSGAGKSHFAARLARALGSALGSAGGAPAVPIVSTDDFLDGWADQLTFWPRLESQVLAPLRHGGSGRYQAYDWGAGRFVAPWREVAPAPAVLLEGFSSARAAVAPELTCAVFVTAPRGWRTERAVARDGEAVRGPLAAWHAVEDDHFAADGTAARAELVVDGAPAVAHDPDTQYVRIDLWTAERG